MFVTKRKKSKTLHILYILQVQLIIYFTSQMYRFSRNKTINYSLERKIIRMQSVKFLKLKTSDFSEYIYSAFINNSNEITDKRYKKIVR